MEKVFFLGGQDIEMAKIKEILTQKGLRFEDGNLNWGAKASDYGDKIEEVAVAGKVPVLIELEVDCNLPETAIVIDHHGSRSGEPPAIIQVLNLISIEPTREDVLVGAMDAGFVFALESIGAKSDEIAEFLGGSALKLWQKKKEAERLFYKVASATTLAVEFVEPPEPPTIKEMLLAGETGFESEIISEAERAVAESEKIGDLIVVRCKHSKSGPITTRLIGNQESQNILILSEDGEVNYFGTGETVRELVEKFPGGWTGGAGLNPCTPEAKTFWEQLGGKAPNTAFYGGYPKQEEILEFLSIKFS